MALTGWYQPCLRGRERWQQGSSCLLLHLTLCFFRSLIMCFVPPPDICQADRVDLHSGLVGQWQWQEAGLGAGGMGAAPYPHRDTAPGNPLPGTGTTQAG